jgi:hypothetical protein
MAAIPDGQAFRRQQKSLLHDPAILILSWRQSGRGISGPLLRDGAVLRAP